MYFIYLYFFNIITRFLEKYNLVSFILTLTHFPQFIIYSSFFESLFLEIFKIETLENFNFKNTFKNQFFSETFKTLDYAKILFFKDKHENFIMIDSNLINIEVIYKLLTQYYKELITHNNFFHLNNSKKLYIFPYYDEIKHKEILQKFINLYEGNILINQKELIIKELNISVNKISLE